MCECPVFHISTLNPFSIILLYATWLDLISRMIVLFLFLIIALERKAVSRSPGTGLPCLSIIPNLSHHHQSQFQDLHLLQAF